MPVCEQTACRQWEVHVGVHLQEQWVDAVITFDAYSVLIGGDAGLHGSGRGRCGGIAGRAPTPASRPSRGRTIIAVLVLVRLPLPLLLSSPFPD